MADAETVHKARKNGERAGKYGERINAEEVIDLLVASSDSKNAERRNANLLLEEMAAKPRWIMAGRHKGGFGGKGRLPDKTYHCPVTYRFLPVSAGAPIEYLDSVLRYGG